jgi:hypothetical protein
VAVVDSLVGMKEERKKKKRKGKKRERRSGFAMG